MHFGIALTFYLKTWIDTEGLMLGMVYNILVTSHGYILFSSNLLCCSALPFLIKTQLLHVSCGNDPHSVRNLCVASGVTVVFGSSWGAGYFPSSYANCVSRIGKCLRFDSMAGFRSRFIAQKKDEQYRINK